MARACAQFVWLGTIQTVWNLFVLLVSLDNTVIKFFKLLVIPANHARLAGIPRPKGCQVWTIATNVRLERKTHAKVPLWVAIVRSVLRIQNQKLKGLPNAFHVRKVVLPRKEVHRAPIVWPANLKKRQTPAKRCVPLVHRAITRTRQTWKRACNAHLGMPNRRPGKRRALNAVLVNSMVMLVLLHVNFARKTRITGTKEETAPALIVLWDGRPTTAVQNAKRAVRGLSVMVAKSAHWDLQEKGVTLMRRSADHVHWGKQRRSKVRPHAVVVI
jgi:hypothetical protein